MKAITGTQEKKKIPEILTPSVITRNLMSLCKQQMNMY